MAWRSSSASARTPTTSSEAIRRECGAVDLVILAGGDGTMNSAVDALVECKLPLGILPTGTANDLARTLEIPTDLAAAAAVIGAGRRHAIDLGCVNGKYFFNAASIGLSAEVTAPSHQGAQAPLLGCSPTC